MKNSFIVSAYRTEYEKVRSPGICHNEDYRSFHERDVS